RSSAILTGIGTVLADDPRLTVRGEDGAFEPGCEPLAPLRVVLDSVLRTPLRAQVLDASAPTLLVHARDIAPSPRFAATDRVAVERRRPGGLDLGEVLRVLARRGINEVQVEAGARLSGALLAAGLVDEILLYQAPLALGDGGLALL